MCVLAGKFLSCNVIKLSNIPAKKFKCTKEGKKWESREKSI